MRVVRARTPYQPLAPALGPLVLFQDFHDRPPDDDITRNVLGEVKNMKV
jgi:hypothetical protein